MDKCTQSTYMLTHTRKGVEFQKRFLVHNNQISSPWGIKAINDYGKNLKNAKKGLKQVADIQYSTLLHP